VIGLNSFGIMQNIIIDNNNVMIYLINLRNIYYILYYT
jgi:hypothetical protein